MQVRRVFISCSQMLMSVPSSLSQSSICFKELFHNSCTCVFGHMRIWLLSSTCTAQWGHCADDQNFHLCLFFLLQNVLLRTLLPSSINVLVILAWLCQLNPNLSYAKSLASLSIIFPSMFLLLAH